MQIKVLWGAVGGLGGSWAQGIWGGDGAAGVSRPVLLSPAQTTPKGLPQRVPTAPRPDVALQVRGGWCQCPPSLIPTAHSSLPFRCTTAPTASALHVPALLAPRYGGVSCGGGTGGLEDLWGETPGLFSPFSALDLDSCFGVCIAGAVPLSCMGQEPGSDLIPTGRERRPRVPRGAGPAGAVWGEREDGQPGAAGSPGASGPPRTTRTSGATRITGCWGSQESTRTCSTPQGIRERGERWGEGIWCGRHRWVMEGWGVMEGWVGSTGDTVGSIPSWTCRDRQGRDTELQRRIGGHDGAIHQRHSLLSPSTLTAGSSQPHREARTPRRPRAAWPPWPPWPPRLPRP